MTAITLEVLTRKPEGPAKPTPLLFVHGAFSSARIWEPFFLPYFAAHGFEAHALSLRGHGGSGGRDGLTRARLKDYVADVLDVAGRLAAPPVVIGTSMGGLVVQKYLQDHPTPAAILLASGPPHGMLPGILTMAFTNPQLLRDMTLMQTGGPSKATLAGARRALFRPDTPDDYIRTVLPDAEAESFFVHLDMMGLDLPPSTRSNAVPVLVLCGEADAFITRGAVEETARTYRTRAEYFPGMPHALMLDPEWEKVAARMLAWLEATLPA